MIPPPSHVKENEKNPTKQKNEDLLDEAIFGVDVSKREITPLQTF